MLSRFSVENVSNKLSSWKSAFNPIGTGAKSELDELQKAGKILLRSAVMKLSLVYYIESEEN